MRILNFEHKEDVTIHFDRIKPFKNVCKITGVTENCNVVVDYVPSDKVIDIVDYRKYFERGFNALIEEIAQDLFHYIDNLIKPKKLKVQVFLENNEHLTDWSVIIEKK